MARNFYFLTSSIAALLSTACEWAPCKIDPKAEECQVVPAKNAAYCKTEAIRPDNNEAILIVHEERYEEGRMYCNNSAGEGTFHSKDDSSDFSWDMPCVTTFDGSTLKVVTEFSSASQKGTYKFVNEKDEILGQGEMKCDLGGPATPVD